MVLAIDVYYYESSAKAVGVLFQWENEQPQKVISAYIDGIEDYVPGQFYKRELPCILELLRQININDLECIIVDSHVYVDNLLSYGLGGHLYEALDTKLPIIGVAKKAFHDTNEVSVPVYRGESNTPLFVSSIGINLEEAVSKIKKMRGEFRIPTILKVVDQESRKE